MAWAQGDRGRCTESNASKARRRPHWLLSQTIWGAEKGIVRYLTLQSFQWCALWGHVRPVASAFGAQSQLPAKPLFYTLEEATRNSKCNRNAF